MRIRATPFVLLILCQCAVKHQPIFFEPFFNEGITPFSSSTYFKIKELESKKELSISDKIYLLNLYKLELNSVSGAQATTLKEKISALNVELDKFSKDTQKRTAIDLPKKYTTTQSKKSTSPKEYFSAYDLWNEDDNENAMSILDGILSSEELLSKLNDSDLFDIHYLKFRIAVDLDELDVCESSYAKLIEINECDKKTEIAAFLLSLLKYSKGNTENALSILEHQCVSGGISEDAKLYWLARLRDALLNDKTLYEESLKIVVPEYYTFLSAMRLKKDIIFSKSMFDFDIEKMQLEVSRNIDSLWRDAEELLKSNLSSEARKYLKKSSSLLKNHKEKNELLYNAHLLQAAGDHLGAFKIYRNVIRHLKSGSEFNFIKYLFPMPYYEVIDALSRQWNIDKLLVYSLMRQESSFDPFATSSSGAMGLLQIMPYVAGEVVTQSQAQNIYKKKFLYNYKENIKWSMYLLHKLNSYLPHLVLISAAYNAGLSRTLTWWKRFGSSDFDIFVELIPVDETKEYIKLVLRNYFYYHAITNGGKIESNLIPLQLPTIREDVLSMN